MQSAVELVAYGVGALAFTVLGLLAEFHSLLRFVAGEVSTGVWLAGVGLLLLYAGVYLLGYEKVLAGAREAGA